MMDNGMHEAARVTQMAKGVFLTLEKIGEEKCEEINKKVGENEISYGDNIKERLENMRADLGSDMFDRIANGSSLMETLDRWCAEKVQDCMVNVIDMMMDFFKENGHSDITREQITAYLQVAASSAMTK